MALVVLSKVEQRLDAVRAVVGGAKVIEVAAAVGVSRQTLHAWVTRYPPTATRRPYRWWSGPPVGTTSARRSGPRSTA